MFFFAFELVGDAQVRECLGAQVERKEMADGIFEARCGLARLVRRGGVIVAVACIDIEACEFRQALPAILLERGQAPGQTVGKFRHQRQTARTFRASRRNGCAPAPGDRVRPAAGERRVRSAAPQARGARRVAARRRRSVPDSRAGLSFGEQIEQWSEEALVEANCAVIDGEWSMEWKNAKPENFGRFFALQGKCPRTPTLIYLRLADFE